MGTSLLRRGFLRVCSQSSSVFLSLMQTLPSSFFHGKAFYFFHFGKVHLQHICCTSAVCLLHVCCTSAVCGCTCAALCCVPVSCLLCLCCVFAGCALHAFGVPAVHTLCFCYICCASSVYLLHICFMFAVCFLHTCCMYMLHLCCMSSVYLLCICCNHAEGRRLTYAWVTDSGCSGIRYPLPARKGICCPKALQVLAKAQAGIW